MAEVWAVGAAVEELLAAGIGSAGLPVTVAARVTMRDAAEELDRLRGAELPLAVVADCREEAVGDRDVLAGLVAACAAAGVRISVFFDVLLDQDIDTVVYGPAVVDQALEVRSAEDAASGVAVVVAHLGNRLRRPSPDDLAIGTEFPVAGEDYTTARRRSLVSKEMGGFAAELRRTVAALRRFPLREVPPWDPSDGQQPVSQPEPSGTGWTFAPRRGTVPNLTDVLNAHDKEDARARLDATEPPAPAAWHEAWRSDPPAVLLTGESGTGKSLVAELLGGLLIPPGGPVRRRVVKVNCASLTLAAFEHLAMGSAPGVWTGISTSVVGHFAAAAHGVLFLDELGDLSPEVQTALLTYLDDRLVRPSGIRPFRAFQHIVAATNRDLEEGVNQQWFRNDLFARFPLRLEIPPLRERSPDELRQLVDFVAQDPQANPLLHGKRAVTHVSRDAVELVLAREFRDGNFRELTETVHRGLARAVDRQSPVLDVADLHPSEDTGRYRSDRASAVVRVAEVQPAGRVVAVNDARDLRLLAQREGKVVLVDDAGVHWVVVDGLTFRAQVPPTQ